MKVKNNIRIFYLVSFLEACVFTAPIWAFFFTSYLNFSFWNALLLVLLSGTVSFLLEIPSWAWADRFWRKNLFLAWTITMILSYSVYLFSDVFLVYIISSIFMWAWYAITSWNFEALIHDNLEEVWEEKTFNKISWNQYSLFFLWRWFTWLVAWHLFVINPLYPVIATLISLILVFISVLLIHEPKQKKSEAKSNNIHIKESINFLIKHKFLLVLIVMISFVWWLGNIYWFTRQPYLEQIWISIEHIWYIFAIWSLISALWSNIWNILQKRFNEIIMVFIFVVCMFLSTILYWIFDFIWAMWWIIISSIVFWFIEPVWNSYLMKHSPKTHKSTLLSIFSFAGTFWYVILSLPSWYLVDIYGLKNIYFYVAMLTLLSLLFYSFYIIKNRKKILQ